MIDGNEEINKRLMENNKTTDENVELIKTTGGNNQNDSWKQGTN